MTSPGRWTLLLVALVGGAARLCADPSAEAALEDYQQLSACRYADEPLSLPPGGFALSYDTATWRLDSGRLWIQEPTAAGALTGLVFEGQGRFRMQIPDPMERRQLARFAERPALEVLDEPFERLVLRTSGDEVARLLGDLRPSGPYREHSLARERHEHWKGMRWHDADARVVAAARTTGGRYLRAEVETAAFGWLTYSYDSGLLEEIGVELFQSRFGHPYVESWLSLDRPEERAETGGPGPPPPPPLDVLHADVRASLVRSGRSTLGRASLVGEFNVEVDLEPVAEGSRALQLWLHPGAEVKAVTDGAGRSLAFLRAQLGKFSSLVPDHYYDRSLVVLLLDPTVRGEPLRLRFRYDLDLDNYAPGRLWYPSAEAPDGGLNDLHTARLELTLRDEYELRAMGSQEGEARAEGQLKTWVWRVERPTKMVTFCFARRWLEHRLTADRAPEVVSFGAEVGNNPENSMFNVAADVLNSVNYFQELFADRLDTGVLHATLIEASHGQSFEGFLHLADFSAASQHPGATELFRAHEVAHQWWGHRVGWASYRDQWLSEAFAEYSAMMFVHDTVDNGPVLFQEILKAYSDEITGSLKSAFSKFTRPGVALLNRAALDRVPPIGHGFRAVLAGTPSGYFSQTYTKGALVLHMLRGLLRGATKGDEAFRDVLRDFVATHRGRPASTADFQAVLERRVPTDWSWFFDQWIYGTAIPTYLWDYELATDEDGRPTVVLTVEQHDVPAGFRMPVPVRVDLKGDRTGQMLIMVDEPRETFRIPLPERPKAVVFNPDLAVLARTRKR